DRDKVLVDQRRDGGILITLAVHDVTPVTPNGSNVEPDRPIEGQRECERLGSPLLPRHGLLGSRAQIGALGGGQVVPECGRSGSLGPRARTVGDQQSSGEAETNDHTPESPSQPPAHTSEGTPPGWGVETALLCHHASISRG